VQTKFAALMLAGAVWAASVSRAIAADNAAAATLLDPKLIFANNCSWCHGDFGRKRGKGPKLAGTSMTDDQLRQRIRKGSSGMMPPYEKSLNAEQIDVLIGFIRKISDEEAAQSKN